MSNFTHIFINSTRRLVSLADAPAIIRTLDVRVEGFLMVDAARIQMDRHGRPCRDAGGWSYGHIQHGHICAGAGGLNSLPVIAA